MQVNQVNTLLAELRALQNDAAARPPGLRDDGQAGGVQFSALLGQSVNKVNALQREAGQLTTAFEKGEPGVDLVEVMVAIQKAAISFQAITEVRNHLVRAYQDVMNMPV